MICLEVSRSNKRLCLAGLARGLWTLHISLINPSERLPTLYVNGAGEEGDFEWVREELAIGELVSFRLLETLEADPPHPSPEAIAAAYDLSVARLEHETLTARLKSLEAQWGVKLKESPDA